MFHMGGGGFPQKICLINIIHNYVSINIRYLKFDNFQATTTDTNSHSCFIGTPALLLKRNLVLDKCSYVLTEMVWLQNEA